MSVVEKAHEKRAAPRARRPLRAFSLGAGRGARAVGVERGARAGLGLLAADPKVLKKSGRVFSSWGLGEEYDLEDVDGRRPHIGKWMAENMPGFLKEVHESEARFCQQGPALVGRRANA